MGFAIRCLIPFRACRLATLACTIGVAACASGSAASGRSVNTTPSDRSRFESTEFRGRGFSNMYDAVASQRSDWLRPVGGDRGTGGTPVVGVFVEGQRRSYDFDYLRQLRPEDVKLLRRIPPSESLHTYGFDWAWGAIVITPDSKR
jgi:hypothetical protein